MRDTSDPALERYYELLRARTPLARLTTALGLSSAVRQLAESSIRAAEPVGADYFLGGSLASSLQGEPRATNDIDFVIALPLGKIKAFRDALGEDFEVDTDMLRDAVLRARCANAFYLPVTKIDFFGRGYEPFDDSEFSRRRPPRASSTTVSSS
jgi:hypothetical protein